uniref:Uncharacterized protein n=1 Tax=Anguilla anguilla TaxID=7936 RepID=A0A0E9SP75_ANGAN
MCQTNKGGGLLL